MKKDDFWFLFFLVLLALGFAAGSTYAPDRSWLSGMCFFMSCGALIAIVHRWSGVDWTAFFNEVADALEEKTRKMINGY